jgi:hypothetical protein
VASWAARTTGSVVSDEDHDEAFYIREGIRLHDATVRATFAAVDA